jgi:hypothetical protein
VNQTDDFSITAVGLGVANGLSHMSAMPENRPAILLASASMDCCCSQLT